MNGVSVDTPDLAPHVVEFDPAVLVEINGINCEFEGDVVSIHHAWNISRGQ